MRKKGFGELLLVIALLAIVALFIDFIYFYNSEITITKPDLQPTILQGRNFEKLTQSEDRELYPRTVPGTNYLIFTSIPYVSDSLLTEKTEIVLLDLETGVKTTIRKNGYAAFPIPNERKYVFSTLKDGKRFLCEGSLDSPAIKYISTTGFSTSTTLQPSVSPNGEEIAFCFARSDDPYQKLIGIFSRKRPFYSVVSNGENPIWSKDGNNILVHQFSGNYEIIKIDTQTGMLTIVLSGNSNYMFPSPSPDNKWLAFRYDNDTIAYSDINGGQVTVVAENIKGLWAPYWGDDGYIYFSSEGDIYRIKPVLPEK